ncbi:SIMPL domain-containing protein [Halosquirtibacter xylanolyticus]|uniref:SIMPL domain-containing protein n=1 Tax=Halosquirtibacter xylanolyticus TaxID=3374599 RepID=UPI00374823D0|nr:SIMPL domain-containing protein [Prolixibacteraceae bacterium]
MIKRILSVFILTLMVIVPSFGQNSDISSESVVWVSGKAEQMVSPKRVYMNIFLSSNPKMKDAESINQLEKDCYTILKRYDINKSDLKVVDVDNQVVVKRKHQLGVHETRSYELEVKDISLLDELFYEFSQNRYIEVSLGRFEYGDLTQIENELAVKATLKAKAKGGQIIKALGNEILRVVSVDVNSSQQQDYRAPRYMKAYSAVKMTASDHNAPNTQDLQVKKMKVVSRVRMCVSMK